MHERSGASSCDGISSAMKFIGIVGEEALKLFCDSHNLQPSTSIHVHLLHTLSEPRERCNDPDNQQIDVLQAGNRRGRRLHSHGVAATGATARRFDNAYST